MKTVMLNDVKKGAELVMTGGRIAKMADNKKGLVRMVEVMAVNGWYHEFGSVYGHDILLADGAQVVLSDAQKKASKNVKAFGF